MPTAITKLDKSFISHFGITKFKEIDNGGQKRVYLVTKAGKECILKLFHDFGKRELRELGIYEEFKRLSGIPKIISIDDYDGDTVVFEELIPGSNLEKEKASFKGDGKRIIGLVTEICTILDPIWATRKIHRDLKPSNIMIKPDNSPTVIDFGIIKDLESETITVAGTMPHTWMYAAPEQLIPRKELISHRTDFFSLGVVAYDLYYQKLPFGKKKNTIIEKIETKSLNYTTNKDCPLNDFFAVTLKGPPSERSRNTERLLKSLGK